MDRREFVLQGLGVVAGAGMAGSLVGCGGGDGGDGGGVTDPGGDDGGGGGGGGGGEVAQEISLTSNPFTFAPDEVTINVGETVRWVNADDTFHTITPDGHDEWERQTMNETDQTFEHTFESAGTFDYFCEPHRDLGMVGRIVVESM